MKKAEKLFLVPQILLLISFFLKLGNFPNQLVWMGLAFLAMIICLIVFLKKQMKMSPSIGKPIHLFIFLMILLVFFLPFVGMFNQKLIPLFIYGAMALSVVFYFFKIHKNNNTSLNLIKPNVYRNFVLQSYILALLNLPIQEVIPDNYYSPKFTPKYEAEKGPSVYMDESHNNYHTAKGLYKTFANVLSKDGYVVKSFTEKFSIQSLQKVNTLVISNAISFKNIDKWEQPVFQAFDDAEIVVINDWVKNGGSLFLIADHMPFSSAAKKLAASFGFVFSDGYARQRHKKGSDLFCRQNNMLLDNEITNGSKASEYVDSIITFYGQAFQIPVEAKSIIKFNEEYIQYSPQVAGDFKDCQPENITGFSQGAYMKYGSGRVVVFGEAAMFSGQFGAGLSWVKVGMNSSEAKNNYKLLLNIIHWLDRKKI